MTTAYLGLGSNLGERLQNIFAALEALDGEGIHIEQLSGIYETEPWGLLEQPRFLNAACAVKTVLDPQGLLRTAKAIEKRMGRVETIRYGPRVIDIDILLYGALVINTTELTIPHPGMLQRASVLVPLNDIAPDLQHPITGLTIREQLEALGPIDGVAPYPPGL